MQNIEELKEDYMEIKSSHVSEGTRLPFMIEFDAERSVLYPENNENQRFCYNVTGIGTEDSKLSNLSHLTLGICDQILKDEIVNIAVTIDGVGQDVCLEEGGGVQLTPRQNSDGISKYSGLEFDMDLDKDHGKMSFSFELIHPCQVGQIKVYIADRNSVTDEISICGPVGQDVADGYIHAHQDASVYIPVEIIPHADAGEIKASCYGEPEVTVREDHTKSKFCFTIIQPICVEIPLEFSAEALLGKLQVKCEEEMCSECKPCEAIYRDSSSDQEPIKPSTPRYNYYKVFF